MRKLVIPVALTALVLVGCKKPEESFIGTWTIKSGASDVLTGPAKNQMKMLEGSTVELTKEKGFRWKVKFGGIEVPMAGKWTLNGDKATATIETLQGQPLENTIKMLPDGPQKQGLENLTKPLNFTKDGEGLKMQSSTAGAPTFLLEKAKTAESK
jgi:hypothetical protein